MACAMILQEVVQGMLETRGFSPLVGTQRVYVHAGSGMVVVAHVDDFLVLGTRDNVLSTLAGLQSDYECTGQIWLYDDGDVQSFKFLGRTI